MQKQEDITNGLENKSMEKKTEMTGKTIRKRHQQNYYKNILYNKNTAKRMTLLGRHRIYEKDKI